MLCASSENCPDGGWNELGQLSIQTSQIAGGRSQFSCVNVTPNDIRSIDKQNSIEQGEKAS
jgi:hypothetical protein